MKSKNSTNTKGLIFVKTTLNGGTSMTSTCISSDKGEPQ